MNEVLLVAVVALAIALMSIVINLMLVARISVLKSDLEWFDKVKLVDLKGQNSATYSGLLSLENKTKDALEIMTNNLNLNGILLEESAAKFTLLDDQVAKHTERLDQLGQFAGITTGELRVLEQKIYKANQTVDGETPVNIKELINRSKANNIEIINLSSKLRKLDNELSIYVGETRGSVKKVRDDLEKLRFDMNSNVIDLTRKHAELSTFVKYPDNYHNIIPRSVETTVRPMNGKNRKKVNYDVEKYKRDKHKMEFEETMRKMGDPYK